MKKLLFSAAVVALLGSTDVSAQLYTPTGSVGTSSTSNFGIGISAPNQDFEVTDPSHAFLRIAATPSTTYNPSTSAGIEIGQYNSSLSYTNRFKLNFSDYPACGSGRFILTNNSASIVYSGSKIYINANSTAGCSGGSTYGDDVALGGTGVKNLLVGNVRTAGPGGISPLQTGYKLGVNGDGYVTGSLAIGGMPSTFTQGFPSGYSLYVANGILTEKVKVAVKNTSDWADYVFAPTFKLKDLSEVEAFIKTNKHLPDVPSASEVVENGIDMAKMDALLLQKIEELTLYVIEIKKENAALKADMAKLTK